MSDIDPSGSGQAPSASRRRDWVAIGAGSVSAIAVVTTYAAAVWAIVVLVQALA